MGEGKKSIIITAEDGVSQGDPLAMALYGIALLPLAENAKVIADEATITPWFANDSAGFGHVEDCAEFLQYLTQEGPTYGYFPEPEKSYFVCKLEDEHAAKTSFHHRGLKVNFCRGKRYVGGFLGSEADRAEYVKEKIEAWADGVVILSSIAKRFPQTAYAGLTISLQAEWQHLARTFPGISTLFDPIERAIRKSFIPALLGVETVDADLRTLIAGGLKQGGLGIRNPVDSAPALYEISRLACSKLTESLVHGQPFNLAEHRSKVKLAAKTGRTDRVEHERGFAEARASSKGVRKQWRLKRAQAAGIWLSVVPNRLNGTELTADEFRDNIRLRYNLQPLDMPEKCDGCGETMTVEHALQCKVGGLVHIMRHDDVAKEWMYLAGQALQPSRVSHEPEINSGDTKQGQQC